MTPSPATTPQSLLTPTAETEDARAMVALAQTLKWRDQLNYFSERRLAETPTDGLVYAVSNTPYGAGWYPEWANSNTDEGGCPVDASGTRVHFDTEAAAKAACETHHAAGRWE